MACGWPNFVAASSASRPTRPWLRSSPSSSLSKTRSSMTDQATAPDQAGRDRITRDLETTLFVEAGAGSGKTSALVNRVVALVKDGRTHLNRIAAITFTEKAGA